MNGNNGGIWQKYGPHVISIVILAALYLLHQHGVTLQQVQAVIDQGEQTAQDLAKLIAQVEALDG